MKSKMYSKMMKTVNAMDNQYLTPPQQKELNDYAKSLPRRFAAMRDIEVNELHIVDAALEAFQQMQPTVGDLADAGWTTVTDDLRLAIRLIVLGYLLDDEDYADVKLLRTLRNQLDYLDLPQDAGRDLFVALAEAIKPIVTAETTELISAAFEAAVERFDSAVAA